MNDKHNPKFRFMFSIGFCFNNHLTQNSEGRTVECYSSLNSTSQFYCSARLYYFCLITRYTRK